MEDYQNNNQYQPPVVPSPGEQSAKNMAIASLVLGIIAAVLCWFGYVALVSIACAIVGIILAAMSNKKYQQLGMKKSGMATAGLVCSVISLALSCIVFFACSALLCATGSLISSTPW